MGLREECTGVYEQGVCKILPDEAGVKEYVAVICLSSIIGPPYQPIILRRIPAQGGAQEGSYEVSAIIEAYGMTPNEAFKEGYKHL